MSKRRKKKTVRPSLRQQWRNRRPVQSKDPDEARILEVLKQAMGRPLTGIDAQALEMGLIQEVLGRMVEIELSRWIHAILTILKEDFGFSEKALVEFSRRFRSAVNEQTAQAPAAAEEK